MVEIDDSTQPLQVFKTEVDSNVIIECRDINAAKNILAEAKKLANI